MALLYGRDGYLDRIAWWYISTLERLTFEYEKKKLCRVLGSC